MKDVAFEVNKTLPVHVIVWTADKCILLRIKHISFPNTLNNLVEVSMCRYMNVKSMNAKLSYLRLKSKIPSTPYHSSNTTTLHLPDRIVNARQILMRLLNASIRAARSVSDTLIHILSLMR